ncbi:DUF4166 domain-containing protein [Roseomonas terrae]|uniref:DUF4166 domain-containing protein n=1 Tax=Neoroseomonas terrae TaxID=424799 RepID=A0ABS5EHS8_9PROT|nr:SDR family oxidoreductase [Neoroseomonas terrae]MBR0650587.1 DUF4166 domain-containing protein [Neoroseomonas terrae]
MKTVLLLGATGAFGERLAEGLVRSGIAVLAAARREAPLRALAARLGPLLTPLPMDRAGLDAARLRALAAEHPALIAVADASGPFQDRPPEPARAAIEAGLHWVDLADARDWVAGIGALDGAARQAGVAVLAGASSTPALSHAVLDVITAGARAIHMIDVAISPGNRAPRGEAVMRAILSRAGQPIRVFRGGRWTTAPGWGLSDRRTIAGLGRRRLSLCETPDLDLLVTRYAPRADALFRAGLELGVMHQGLAALSWLVEAGLLRSLLPLTRPLHGLARLLAPFGTDRGGMEVSVVAEEADGVLRRRCWTLVAEEGDGPFVPTLPALAALRGLADGSLAFRGAAPCVGILDYDRIAETFAAHRITTRIDAMDFPAPLFARLLGEGTLPAAIVAGHAVAPFLALEGRGSAEGAANPLGALAARLFGLPAATAEAPLRVEMRAAPDGTEAWERHWPGRTMRSVLRADGKGGIEERFGPLTGLLALRRSADGLVLETTGARAFGLRLPRFLAPISAAREYPDAEGRFAFDVPIAVPLLGRLTRYRGWLSPVA